MRSEVVLCVLLAACGGGGGGTIDSSGSGDDQPDAMLSPSCLEAQSHSDLAWITDNIFSKQCAFSGCHNGQPTDQGKMDIRTTDAAITSLVSVDSHMCPGTPRVVPGHPEQSWLLKMMGQFDDTTPGSCTIDPKIGLMPMDNNGELLCKDKRDAIERWIMAGATND